MNVRAFAKAPKPSAAAPGAEIAPYRARLIDPGPWRDLAATALERSVFSEPTMAEHAAGTVDPNDWSAVSIGSAGELDALVLVRPAKTLPILGTPILDAFHSHYGPRNPPLLRSGRVDAADRLLAALAGLGGVVRLFNQAIDGPVVAALSSAAERRGGIAVITDAHERALLLANKPDGVALGPALEGRRLKELDRQMRRLGAVSHQTYTTETEVSVALEAFIALERMGWKGARGTSLADDDRRLAFARGFVASLAAENRVRADVLAAADRVLAVLLTLCAGDVAFLWKIAHDPDFAQASPGVQVARLATRGLLDDPAIRLVDSLAAANHPMVDRLWRGRIRIGTLFLALSPSAVADTRRAARHHERAEGFKRRLRGWLGR